MSNIVLNCTDEPQECEYCGEAIPPNSDHECMAKCAAPAMHNGPSLPRYLGGLIGGPVRDAAIARLESQLSASQKLAGEALERAERAEARLADWNRTMSEVCPGSEFIDNPKAVLRRIRETQATSKHMAVSCKAAREATERAEAQLAKLQGAIAPIWERVEKPTRTPDGKLISVHTQDVFVQASEIERLELALAAGKE